MLGLAFPGRILGCGMGHPWCRWRDEPAVVGGVALKANGCGSGGGGGGRGVIVAEGVVCARTLHTNAEVGFRSSPADT